MGEQEVWFITMKQRIITGVLLILLLVSLLLLPGWGFALAALIAVGMSTWEEYHALTLAGHRVVSWPAWVVLIGSVPLTKLFGTEMIVPLMTIALLMMVVQILFREALPLLGDTFALFIGTAVGGKKLCPPVSPHKTVAGSIGGMAGSMLAALLVYLIARWTCNEATLAKLPTFPAYLMLGFLGGVVGQIGDLFASLVKRHSGIKDFSNLFPGHGGMLDRLDSVLFMAVLVYCYLTFMV